MARDPLPLVARANRALDRAWNLRLLPRPRLDPEVLERTALRGRAPSAFGEDERWRIPFQRLLAAIDQEAGLSPLGQAMAHGQIVMALRSRIRAKHLWARHPEISHRPLDAPIIILGQMRSGTTRLQRLLACDSRLAYTKLEESLIPVPFGAPSALPDRRKAQAALMVALLGRLNPEIRRIHPSSVGAPEEEFGLFAYSFGSAQFEAQWWIPAFSRWWEETESDWLYAEFRRLLQTAQWSRRDHDRPILLKAPHFLQDLPTLHRALPDARFLLLERPPEEVIASSASLVWNQMRIQSEHADPHRIGQEWLRKTVLRESRSRDFFDRPDAPAFLRVGFEEMNRDWRAAMGRIYNFLGLELDDRTERQMAAFVAGSRAHLGHHYSLQRFGLSPEMVKTALEGDLPPGRSLGGSGARG